MYFSFIKLTSISIRIQFFSSSTLQKGLTRYPAGYRIPKDAGYPVKPQKLWDHLNSHNLKIKLTKPYRPP